MGRFVIAPGERLQWWLGSGLLRAPGGAGGVTSNPRSEEDGDLRVIEYEAKPRPEELSQKTSGQWHRAQDAEIAFWKTFRKSALYGDIDMIAHWEGVLDRTGGGVPAGTVLDVGCGPCSVLNYFRDNETIPLGVDPLAESYHRHRIIESRPSLRSIPMAGVLAEALPLASESIDHAFCYNVLDHVQDAPAVLREIHRVLKPGGTLRTYVHSFVGWSIRLLFWDRPHTYHWTHEEFLALVTAGGFSLVTARKEPKEFGKPRGILGKLRFLPYRIAPYVMFTTYAVHVRK